MKVKWEKCEFERQDIKFLGHYIKQGRILVDNDKLALLETWKPPLVTVRQVRQFMGFSVILSGVYSGVFNIDGPLDGIVKRKEN